MKFDWKDLIKQFIGFVKESWSHVDVGSQRIILGVLVIVLGVAVPWGGFGEVGSYIQMGLVGGGLISAFYSYKKLGEKKEKEDDGKRFCSECGREL